MKYNYPVKWIKKVRFHWNKVRNRDIKENFILYFGENDVIINTKKALPRLKRINPKIKTRIIKNSGNSPYWDNYKEFKKYFVVDIKEIYQEWLKGKTKNDK